MKKKIPLITASLLVLLGLLSLFLKGISGSYLDQQGFLHEKFFLIPLGFLLLFTGILLFIIILIKKLF